MKVKPNLYRGVTGNRWGSTRVARVVVQITRTQSGSFDVAGRMNPGKKSEAFLACAGTYPRGKKHRGNRTKEQCAYGSNPRQAMGRAVEKFGRELKGKNRGAFAGIK